jgi:hypothetical protein
MSLSVQESSGVHRQPATLAGTIAPPRKRWGWSHMTQQQQENLALLVSVTSLAAVVVAAIGFFISTGRDVERFDNRLRTVEFFVLKLGERAGIPVPPATQQ